MNNNIKEICFIDKKIYSCITEHISAEKVILTSKSVIHIANKHPDALEELLIELKETLLEPDYILRDEAHYDTGLVIRRIASEKEINQSIYIVLKISSDSTRMDNANLVISGWKISEKRLKRYLKSKPILYKKE